MIQPVFFPVRGGKLNLSASEQLTMFTNRSILGVFGVDAPAPQWVDGVTPPPPSPGMQWDKVHGNGVEVFVELTRIYNLNEKYRLSLTNAAKHGLLGMGKLPDDNHSENIEYIHNCLKGNRFFIGGVGNDYYRGEGIHSDIWHVALAVTRPMDNGFRQSAMLYAGHPGYMRLYCDEWVDLFESDYMSSVIDVEEPVFMKVCVENPTSDSLQYILCINYYIPRESMRNVRVRYGTNPILNNGTTHWSLRHKKHTEYRKYISQITDAARIYGGQLIVTSVIVKDDGYSVANHTLKSFGVFLEGILTPNQMITFTNKTAFSQNYALETFNGEPDL